MLQFRNECDLTFTKEKDRLLLQTFAKLLCYPADLFSIECKGCVEVRIKVVAILQVTQIIHVFSSVSTFHLSWGKGLE